MALVERERAGELAAALARDYYDPAGLEPDLFTCFPVAGSGILTA